MANVLCIELFHGIDYYKKFNLYEKFPDNQIFWNPQSREFYPNNYLNTSVELGYIKKLPDGTTKNLQIQAYKPSREEKQKVFDIVLAEELCK